MRLGIKMAHHAYILPEGVDVGYAARVARMQGGVLHVVSERIGEVEVVDFGGPGTEDDMCVDVAVVETVWGDVISGEVRDVDVRGVGVHPTVSGEGDDHSPVRVLRSVCVK